MTAAAVIGLRAARLVTDVMDGTATAGSGATLTDSANLIQPNAHWDRGTVFFLSGAGAGKAAVITGYAGNRLTFASLGANPIAAGDRYAVMRGAYPLAQILSAMTQALDVTHVTGVASALRGDGETLEFTLPAEVRDVKGVEFEDIAAANSGRKISSHWQETSAGKLRFDYGYAPEDGYAIHVYYRKPHDEISAYSTEINAEIDTNWLTHKTAENLLWWGLGIYGNSLEYRIEERMNRMITALKGKAARRGGPDIIFKTAGARS